MSHPLTPYGWDAHWSAAFDAVAAPEDAPARVLIGFQDRMRIGTPDGECDATYSGRLRDVTDRLERPSVGDWVTYRSEGESAVIQSVLPRRTVFVRRAAGERDIPQIIAANVERVFIVSSLNREFNPRRLERYVAATFAAGASPYLVLNKADLDGPDSYLDALPAALRALPCVVTCALTGEGVDGLRDALEPGVTVAFVGSSGVGKSSLVNALLGAERFATADVRDTDDRGRHTTRNRTLLPLPTGAILIDTPGMRELKLWLDRDQLAEAFADVEEVASDCRFRNCTHSGEPGCAVEVAVAEGALSAARVASYLKLLTEPTEPARRGR